MQTIRRFEFEPTPRKKSLIHSSKKGCFEEQIDIRFSARIVEKIGGSVITQNFWDYLQYCWAAALGLKTKATSSHLNKVVERDAEFGYVIGDALESAMQEVHKPIAREPKVKIYLARPRVGDILQLNRKTLEYVTTRTESAERMVIKGNVTRYNVLSDFGRLYSDNEKRVVSFKLAHPNDSEMKQQVVQSMQDHVAGEPGKLLFTASKIISELGEVKRYLVHKITRA